MYCIIHLYGDIFNPLQNKYQLYKKFLDKDIYIKVKYIQINKKYTNNIDKSKNFKLCRDKKNNNNILNFINNI